MEIQQKCLSFPNGFLHAVEINPNEDTQDLKVTRLEAL